MLRIVVIICALFALNGSAYSDDFTFRVRSDYKFTAQVHFLSQTRAAAWPGDNQAYDLLDSDVHHFALNCTRGEQICLDAFDRDNPNQMRWSTKTIARCPNCCWTCSAGNRTPIIVLSTLSAVNNKRRPIMRVDQSPDVGVDGKDLRGGDLNSFPANSALACHNSCGGEPMCKAWTWKKSTRQCFLKNTVPNLVADKDCISGPIDGDTAEKMTKEFDTDRLGSDKKSFATADSSACAGACKRESACAAWSYVRPTKAGESGTCFIKDRVPQPDLKIGVISGVKYRRANF